MLSHNVNLGGLSGSYRVAAGFQCHTRCIVPLLTGVVSLSAVEAVSSIGVGLPDMPCPATASVSGELNLPGVSSLSVGSRVVAAWSSVLDLSAMEVLWSFAILAEPVRQATGATYYEAR
jgi:hypothetical protein